MQHCGWGVSQWGSLPVEIWSSIVTAVYRDNTKQYIDDTDVDSASLLRTTCRQLNCAVTNPFNFKLWSCLYLYGDLSCTGFFSKVAPYLKHLQLLSLDEWGWDPDMILQCTALETITLCAFASVYEELSEEEDDMYDLEWRPNLTDKVLANLCSGPFGMITCALLSKLLFPAFSLEHVSRYPEGLGIQTS